MPGGSALGPPRWRLDSGQEAGRHLAAAVAVGRHGLPPRLARTPRGGPTSPGTWTARESRDGVHMFGQSDIRNVAWGTWGVNTLSSTASLGIPTDRAGVAVPAGLRPRGRPPSRR